jgi:hypothetical protein
MFIDVIVIAKVHSAAAATAQIWLFHDEGRTASKCHPAMQRQGLGLGLKCVLQPATVVDDSDLRENQPSKAFVFK